MGKKWNQDAKPSEKMLSMYTMLLFTGKEASLSELSAELGCSKQAVLRLIDQLEASRFGKLLRYKRGRETIYCLDRPKRLPKISLNAEGLHQLALCRDFMLHLLPGPMRKNVDATLQQASAYVSENDIPMSAQDAGLLSVGDSFSKGRIDYSPFQEILHTFIKAIREKKICAVRYKASIAKEPNSFDFAPKRLVAFRESILIHGWIVPEKTAAPALDERPYTLALQRVQKAGLTRRNADSLPDVGMTHGVFGLLEGEPFPVRIQFAPGAATYVAEREWSADQKITLHKNGGLTLALTARSPAEVISWVLGFGEDAEIISPAWLRDDLARQIRALAVRYEKAGSQA